MPLPTALNILFSKQCSEQRNAHPSRASNVAVESTLAIQGTAPSIRSPPSSETISVNRTWRADRTEDANRLEHANGHEHTGDTAPSNWTSAADVTPRFPRLIITDASADNRHTVRPLIPAFGSPSLRPRAPTDDGGRQARVNSLTGVAPRAYSTTTLGGARRPSLARASSRGALANDSVPENGVFPGRADTSQAAGDVHISDNDIIADGPLPAAGDTPIVGTMPAIGRDAYITVQCPNGEFYTVRIDLTNAAPNVTYNISINIPPCPPPSPPSPP
ncbi:hypothetical protein F5883DRAFT_665180 [Diaporthe sp. PMI_573]|nr:hypothetical protein F5883DRAFT_665180 [Diaporthaceae sp. PMI_573]